MNVHSPFFVIKLIVFLHGWPVYMYDCVCVCVCRAAVFACARSRGVRSR